MYVYATTMYTKIIMFVCNQISLKPLPIVSRCSHNVYVSYVFAKSTWIKYYNERDVIGTIFILHFTDMKQSLPHNILWIIYRQVEFH